MSSPILIVEDEKEIADLMALHLKKDGHEVLTMDNGEEAFGFLQSQKKPQLIILDWMLPGLSGLEICKRIRHDKNNRTPILMVTARAHTSDIVLGLEMGADDYLTKPFELPIFLARVRALLRRTTEGVEGDTFSYRFGELSVDLNSYKVTCGKKELTLTPSEFKLLASLMKSQGRVLTREQLIDKVQGEGVTVVDRAIDTHIFGLRKKLGKCSEVVETIRGVGYRVRI
jgi:two-component system phosphate regulon response regulator PhoB